MVPGPTLRLHSRVKAGISFGQEELMPDLSTTYMGLRLKNPLIAGSCGLTGTLAGLKELEAGGAAAVWFCMNADRFLQGSPRVSTSP